MRSKRRDNQFPVARFFLKLVCQNDEDEKGYEARVAGRRKQTKKLAEEQLCMDNIPIGLNESGNSSASDSTKESL